MTPEQEEILRAMKTRTTYSIHADALKGYGDRTLLYGYDVNRKTWHVYLMDGEIHLHVYDHNRITITKRSDRFWLDAHKLMPNKRLYPEACDFDFLQILRGNGVQITPRTTFGGIGSNTLERFKETGFYGEL